MISSKSSMTLKPSIIIVLLDVNCGCRNNIFYTPSTMMLLREYVFFTPPVQSDGSPSVRSSCMLCLFCGLVTIWQICFICGTNTTHEGMLWCAPSPCQLIKGQGHIGHQNFSPCPLHGLVPIWRISFICGTDTTHEWTMCYVQFPGQ